MDFQFSDKVRDLQERLTNFMDDQVYPIEEEYPRHVEEAGWSTPPIMDRLKETARSQGLWNLFMPDPEHGAGLNNLEYSLADAFGLEALAERNEFSVLVSEDVQNAQGEDEEPGS